MDLKTEINLEMGLKIESQVYSCLRRISEPAIEISAHKTGEDFILHFTPLFDLCTTKLKCSSWFFPSATRGTEYCFLVL
ncbi:hypothetical protein RchiOBHm_Chr5g0068541 [Rosa chinensis]|uniref:Uncharacterized protein n=1 Tax=Rosa chinensis TaxID=74649 RepID=A0A2P6QJQ2_ROSCH|nr:hypothetical protein RchiOBHm_Chr5g0068531 [Rosa chinensis]PRQ34398.1 hypothetical protein RchiOBHm_Chr5g0068541 [Rosa chinensis]